MPSAGFLGGFAADDAEPSNWLFRDIPVAHAPVDIAEARRRDGQKHCCQRSAGYLPGWRGRCFTSRVLADRLSS